MSIVFDKGIVTDKVYAGFNDNVLIFHSNTSGKTSVRAVLSITDINIGSPSLINIELTPDLSGKFRFNLLEVTKFFLTKNHLEDTFNYPDLSSSPTSVFSDDELYVKLNIITRVYYSDNTSEHSGWVHDYKKPIINKSVVQIGESTQQDNFVATPSGSIDILTPYYDDGMYKQHLKYWEGFPFDFSTPCWLNHNIDIEIETPGVSNFDQLNTTHPFIRVVINDYENNEITPISAGKGNIEFTTSAGLSISEFGFEKVANCGGVYLKWLNPQGGWSYWLFSDFEIDSRSSKNLKDFNRNYDDVSEITGTKISFGKDIKDIKQLTYDANEQDWATVQTIHTSPKVYLYKGNGKWLNVKIKDNTFNVFKTNKKIRTVSLTLEMPEIFTQTI